MGSRETGDNQVTVTPRGRGVPQDPRGGTEEETKKITGQAGRQGGRDAKGAGRGGTQEGGAPKRELPRELSGMGKRGHLELGNWVMCGLGVT